MRFICHPTPSNHLRQRHRMHRAKTHITQGLRGSEAGLHHRISILQLTDLTRLIWIPVECQLLQASPGTRTRVPDRQVLDSTMMVERGAVARTLNAADTSKT